MNKLLLPASIAMFLSLQTTAETIMFGNTPYQAETLIERDLGPGVKYTRLRITDFPLNVNMLVMDLDNPYTRVETMPASETLYKTEALSSASKRMTTPGHKVLGGANANFWCVATQEPWSDKLIGATYNANLRNGKIITETNHHSDQWVGGWKKSAIVGIDTDKNMWVKSMAFYATAINNEKLGQLEIIQSNKVCRDGELVMYNSFYGTSKKFMPVDQYVGTDGKNHFMDVAGQATEVLLDLAEGQRWMSAEDIEFVVKEVRTDAGQGTLGNNDLALVGRGANKDLLAKLVPGDKVTVNYGWSTSTKGRGDRPKLEQIIGGLGTVLLDGELTDANDMSYNAQVYSRTGYGTSADRRKLFVIVIDKSNDKIYGNSKGCSTREMCYILKHYGCASAVSFDAGGSAEMLVEGKVINTTTEGNPRAVANGMFLISTAPEDNTVARLEFEENTLQAPVYSSFTPKVLGYNQYGDLIDTDVKGFTLSCPAELGSCSGSVFTAGGTQMSGLLTATYNGVSVSKNINVLSAELKIRINPILIDATRSYAMEVTASIGDNVYTYDPSSIEWTVEDNSVAMIDEKGVLKGLKEGTTEVTGRIGDFVDKTSVTVEIAPSPRINETDWSSWATKASSGITKTAIDGQGTLSFTYGSPRTPYVRMSKDLKFYSLPDRIVLTFVPSIDLKYIDVDIRSASKPQQSIVKVTPTDGTVFKAGAEVTINLPIEHAGNPADLASYPYTLKQLDFYTSISSANKGEQTIAIKDLHAEYDNYSAGVEDVTAGDGASNISVWPNPVMSGSALTVSGSEDITAVELFNLSGASVYSSPAGQTVVNFDIPALAPGVYMLSVSTKSGNVVRKVIVK